MERRNIPLVLKYNEPCLHDKEKIFENLGDSMNSSPSKIELNVNDDWERWSLPIGNGYFGVNVFGRCKCEKYTLAEKTMSTSAMKTDNYLIGGLNTFAEIYLDTNHNDEEVENYERSLDIEKAIAYVSYIWSNVKYTRECFTSYPDKCFVIKMESSVKEKLDFTFRPIIPYKQEYMQKEGDGGSKTGKIETWVDNNEGNMELSGNFGIYNIDFCGLARLYTDGVVIQDNILDYANEQSGTIKVEKASFAYIVMTLDTNYVLEPDVFLKGEKEKPTESRDYSFVYSKVKTQLDKITNLISNKEIKEGYEILKKRHIDDFSSIFSRVHLDLDVKEEDFEKTTDRLLFEYKEGKESKFLETLYFQYGRYLLISSSREGSLPAHLQGAWNKYRQPMWTSGYWHNINVQMNYWPAFCTNIAETFKAYISYHDAFMPATEEYCDEYVKKYNPDMFGRDGGNGWCIGVGNYPNKVTGDRSAGNIGFTTQLFWDYYEFTQDKDILKKVVYPKLCGAAKYITKCVKKDENGKYLVEYCDSPEQYVGGVWYYTKGTTYAQTFAYLNNYNLLLCAKELGINLDNEDLLNSSEYSILKTIIDQIDKYDPIIIGLSGQIKEFREEEYYGDLGENTHRHISNLVGLYPGNLINEKTRAWLDSSKVTLTNRGDKATGWGVAHRLNLWARTKDGNRTYQLLKQLLKRNTAPNLWDLHPPFQIDGNFGGCAGICEMLIQSHEGYIDPLPAIPNEWDSGSYSGLVCRGNFTIDASWENGNLTKLKIHSRAGKKACVKIRNGKEIHIKDSLGKDVEYERCGFIISFNTKIDEKYEISGFVNVDKVKPIRNLTHSKNKDGITLNWEDDENAVYNIYIAKESEKDYTFISQTKEKTFFVKLNGEDLKCRLSLCVTKTKDNLESMRVCTYYCDK